MALKEYLLLTILIISVGISRGLTWSPNVHRYESYDLERGPVFYEAYYPDNNEESRSNYEEKRYVDRGAVLERSYQVPADQLYPENTLQADDYRNAGGLPRTNGYIDRRSVESVVQTERENRLPLEQDYNARNGFVGFQRRSHRLEGTLDGRLPKVTGQNVQPLDIREISNIARRAISRDLENWNIIENYLDRVKYQNQRPAYRQRAPAGDLPGFDPVGQLPRGVDSLESSFRRERNSGVAGFREPMQEDSSRFRGRIELPGEQRSPDVIGKLTAGGSANTDSFAAFDQIRYRNRIPSQNMAEPRAELSSDSNGSTLGSPNSQNPQRASETDSYPPENIFEPRPQVINYIFSKNSNGEPNKTVQNVSPPEEGLPHSYGDNLIQEEIKKAEEESKKQEQGVGVTSIKVSEEPRHKTRHHHGEWPKRDYSHRHQP